MKQNRVVEYIVPEIEVIVAVAEYGYAGSLLEDPVVNPEQDW